MNKLEFPGKLLDKAYKLLLKNNQDNELILVFLAKLILFLYLGYSGNIDPFPKLLNQLQSALTGKDLSALFKNDFNKLPELYKNFSKASKSYNLYIQLPEFSKEFIQYLKDSSFLNFNWTSLDPLELCHLFESLINTEEKHSNGIFFTSKENINKLINPLFLEEYKKKVKQSLNNPEKAILLLDELSALTFLDPASGVGNFLVETYLELNKLEKEILEGLKLNKIEYRGSHVSTNQLYGIEIKPSSVFISQIILFLAELSQNPNLLKNNKIHLTEKITQANALLIDWNAVIENEKLDYIIGNPPFIGARRKNSEQLKELEYVFGKDWKNIGLLDYVSGWFKKAYDYMKKTEIKAAFVSTSSVTEGVSPAVLFKPLIADGFTINFAYESFKWTHEFETDTTVFVVIIGFSAGDNSYTKYLYRDNKKLKVEHINGYLFDGPEIYAESRNRPICPVPQMGIGNKPVDGGNYLFKEDEYLEFIQKEPESKKFFHPFYGVQELVKQKPRYCLWLGEENPQDFQNLPLVMERVEKVRQFRLNSKSKQTRKIADKPTGFHVENNPDTNYLVIPRISTNAREYLPIGYLTPNEMTSDSVLIVPDVNLYHFGVLTSHLHMIWLNFVCGRLGSTHRYSKEIVYNNFPWPSPALEEVKEIQKTAENILKIREKYKNLNLNTLYNPKTMPEDLKQAHLKNDQAVIDAYHFNKNDIKDERSLIMLLFKRYQEILEPKQISMEDLFYV